ASRAARGIASAVSMMPRHRCGPCCSPFPPQRIDIYTAAPSADKARLTPTRANAPRRPIVARTRLAGGVGLRCTAFRAALCRLAGAGGFTVLRFLRLFGAIRDYLKIRTRLLGGPPGQHLALQPRVVSAGGLKRALRDGKLDALALQACTELIDAPFGLGAI